MVNNLPIIIPKEISQSVRRWPTLGIPPRGIVMFAHNNEVIDYSLIALCNAACIKYNMNDIHITMITDHRTREHCVKNYGSITRRLINNWSTTISPGALPKNSRTIRDSNTNKHDILWYNRGRETVWDLSPYDETILIDSDYFILDNSLNNCWGSVEDIMFNKTTTNIDLDVSQDLSGKISDTGIDLYWATAVYFNRSDKSKMFFDLCGHISEHWDYYCLMYRLPGRLFRNDYVFSIATHILNDMYTRDKVIAPLPIPHLLCSWDKDELIEIGGINNFRFLLSNDNNYTYTSVRDMNVHIMNKLSILRVAQDILNTYLDEMGDTKLLSSNKQLMIENKVA